MDYLFKDGKTIDYFETINGPLIQPSSSNLGKDGFLLNHTIVMNTFGDVLEEMSDKFNYNLVEVAKKGFLKAFKSEVGIVDDLKNEKDLLAMEAFSRNHDLVLPFELRRGQSGDINKEVLIRNKIGNMMYRRTQICKIIRLLLKGTASNIRVNDFYLKVIKFEKIMSSKVFDSSIQKYYYVRKSSNHENSNVIFMMQNRYQRNNLYNIIIKCFDEFRCWVMVATALNNSMFLGESFFELTMDKILIRSNDDDVNRVLCESMILQLYPRQILFDVIKRLSLENTIKQLTDFVKVLQMKEVSLTCSTTIASILMQATEIILPGLFKERPNEVIPTTYREVIDILKENKLANFTQNELIQVVTRGIFLDRSRLKITIPLSFLMPPYVTNNHFYGLSVILSHELFHSVDSFSSQRVNKELIEDSNLTNISRRITQKIQDISFDGLSLAPNRTQNEDLADYVGLHVAFEVSATLTDNFFQRDFFEVYAKLFSVRLTISDQKKEILESDHSPVFVRCNLQLSLLLPFRKWCEQSRVTPMFG